MEILRAFHLAGMPVYLLLNILSINYLCGWHTGKPFGKLRHEGIGRINKAAASSLKLPFIIDCGYESYALSSVFVAVGNAKQRGAIVDVPK